MKYQCVCGKTFIHPAKKTLYDYGEPDRDITASTGTSTFASESLLAEMTETHVCPFCQSLEYTEFAEPQPEITSVVNVDLADVDAKLKEGYVVESLYAKTATLVRRESKVTEK